MLMIAANKVRDPLAREDILNSPLPKKITEPQLEQVLSDSSPEAIISNIPITKFKPSHILTDHKELRAREEEKQDPSSPVHFQEALRLPNISLKQTGGAVSPTSVTQRKDGYSSPTPFLMGNQS